MKKLLAIAAYLLLLTACNRAVCPAYMDGGSTGMAGDHSKKQELFPPEFKKK